MENQATRISLKYWYKVMTHVLYIGTRKITNLNHTILPNNCSSRIPFIMESPAIMLYRRGFTNLFACFAALTELDSISFSLSALIVPILNYRGFFWEQYLCFYHASRCLQFRYSCWCYLS